MERTEATACVGLLKSAYPHMDFPLESVELYVSAISDLPFELCKAGCMNLITEPGRRFMPTIGEIREAALNTIDSLPSAEEAWGEVVEQFRRAGYYGTPDFSHVLVGDAVQVMGWRNLCMSPVESRGVDRAHFFKIYDSLKRRQREDALMLPAAREIMRKAIEEATMPKLTNGNGSGALKPLSEMWSTE